jgi:hypothetical protein
MAIPQESQPGLWKMASNRPHRGQCDNRVAELARSENKYFQRPKGSNHSLVRFLFDPRGITSLLTASSWFQDMRKFVYYPSRCPSGEALHGAAFAGRRFVE